MSSKNTTTTQLAGQKRKRQDPDEVIPADENPGVDRVSHHNKKKSSSGNGKHSHHKKKHSHPSDAEMNEDEDYRHRLGGSKGASEGEGDSVADDDEDGEDDDYDEEDDSSMKDFIADDNELEEEYGEEEDVEGKKRKHRKKRRHHHHPKPLDEEDIELMQENMGQSAAKLLGVHGKQRKRLHKVSEKEPSAVGGADDEGYVPGGVSQEQSKIQSTFAVKGENEGSENEADEELFAGKNKRQIQDDGEEDLQLIDTSSRKRFIKPADRRSGTFVDSEKAMKARQIFDDPSTVAAKVKAGAGRKGKTEGGEDDGNLESIFDAGELDDQFATKEGRLIQRTDIPERLQLKIGDRLLAKMGAEHLKVDIETEIHYIFHRMAKMNKNRERHFHENAEQIKFIIQEILYFIRRDYLDIPYIILYRKYEFASMLEDDEVWAIYQFDLEYGKFRAQFKQLQDFLLNVLAAVKEYSQSAMAEQEIKILENYLVELDRLMNGSCEPEDLKNFNPLTLFLKMYFNKEILAKEVTEGFERKQGPSVRGNYDFISQAASSKYDIIVRSLYMNPIDLVVNILNNDVKILPPPTSQQYMDKLNQVGKDDQNQYQQMFGLILKLAAIEYSVQPYIRKQVKNHITMNGYLQTEPTEEGQKMIDVLSPSYRVKRIAHKKLSELIINDLSQLSAGDGDIFLDIVQNEQKGLIKVNLGIDQEHSDFLKSTMLSKLAPPQCGKEYQAVYVEPVVKMLIEEILLPELMKEIREELFESAENFIIKNCSRVYHNLLMTGPFLREDYHQGVLEDPNGSSTAGGPTPGAPRVQKRSSQAQGQGSEVDLLPDRQRCTVMGVILNQIDSSTQVVTIAIVDKYGELVAHQNFYKLMPPRKMKSRQGGGSMTEEEELKQKKHQFNILEEQKEHDADREKISKMINQYGVDLIVVGANKLEARTVKRVLVDISEKLRTFAKGNDEEAKQGEDSGQKEVYVIWGCLQVPKLYANSHAGQSQFKGADMIIKQAVSLARFEQDPLIEILNLWSFVSQDNQALQLSLHPLQRMVNQNKLADALEDENAKVVNAIGVDLNLVVAHDHMHILLSFVSGLGPRKAKVFIQNLKKNGEKIVSRAEIYTKNLQSKNCHYSSIGFLKIKIPIDEINQKKISVDILDQTRLHVEHYAITMKIASDIEFQESGVPLEEGQRFMQQYMAVKSVIQKPQKLREVDVELYRQQLEISNQQHVIILINYIIDELQKPFRDPRQYRLSKDPSITNQQLFYMLIDETERTFKRGMIVTAQVMRVFENSGRDEGASGGGFALCKLDNGLDAKVEKSNLDNAGNRGIEDLLQSGHVITGRIDEIRDKDESKFSVSLNCKRKDLETHENYAPKEMLQSIPKEDLINPTFYVDNKSHHQSRNQVRRINHPKFKNVNSQRAIQMLQDLDVGEFIFRPSSRGPNTITLTWKFYNNNIVHINIEEHDKAPGATIGSKLQIGKEELYDNLQEIVERYIAPCNKFLNEAIAHIKFIESQSSAELDQHLKNEKQNEPTRIPYKFTILPEYPQHIVLAYIPRQMMTKEYIKIKPKGFFFHDEYYKQIQALVNYFKAKYNDKEYRGYAKRMPSPRAKAPEIAPPRQQVDMGPGASDQWTGLGKNWEGGNTNRDGSVHSINNDDAGRGGQDRSRPQPQFASMGRGRGGGDAGKQGCYNCGGQGHMARDCPNKSERRQFGSGGGRGEGRGQPRRFGGDDAPAEASSNNWGESRQVQSGNTPQYGDASSWGAPTELQPSTLSGDWNNPQKSLGATQSAPDVIMSEPGQNQWGQKTPHRSDNFNEGGSSGWGNADNNAGAGNDVAAANSSSWDNAGGAAKDSWGASGGADNDLQADDGRGSRGRGGMGRGRGREDFGGSIRPGPAGNGRACFKCNQEGHMARDCPNPPVGGGAGRGGPSGGNRACFKCNQEGHMAKDCPQAGDDGNRGRGGRGLRPSASGPNGSGSKACYKCNQEGHISRDCTSDQGYKRQRNDDGGSNRRGGFGRGQGGSYDHQPSSSNDNNWGDAGGASESNRSKNKRDAGGDQWGDAPSNNNAQQDAFGGGGSAWGNNSGAAFGGEASGAQQSSDAWGANPSAGAGNSGFGSQPANNNNSSSDGWGR